MRPLLLGLLLLPVIGFAKKNPCKKIIKTVDHTTGTIAYKSPTLMNVTVIKQYRSDVFFALLLNIHDNNGHFDVRGAEVQFDDSVIIRDDNATINCTQEMAILNSGIGSGLASESSGYVLQAYVRIDPSTVEKFITHKVTRIQIDNISKKVSANDARKIQDYVSCLKNAKL